MLNYMLSIQSRNKVYGQVIEQRFKQLYCHKCSCKTLQVFIKYLVTSAMVAAQGIFH